MNKVEIEAPCRVGRLCSACHSHKELDVAALVQPVTLSCSECNSQNVDVTYHKKDTNEWFTADECKIIT